MKQFLTTLGGILLGILLVMGAVKTEAAIGVGWTATSTDPGFISPTVVNGNNPQLLMTNGGTVASPSIQLGSTGNQGIYQAGTNSLGLEAAGAGFQWNGTAVTPNATNKTIGSFTNPWRKLYFGDNKGGWNLATSTSNLNTALLTSGGYPSVIIGADDASPVSNVELNDLNQGPYGSFGIKVNNGGGTFDGYVVLDTQDTIAGIPQYLALSNHTGSATCLQIQDNGATCLSDYNGLSSLLDTISPAYSPSGTESGMTTTLLQANGQDAVDYGLQNYPGTFATGIDAYQNYYANNYATPLPEPHFSFWEQANGNTSEASTSWGFLGATTTVSGANATTTSVDIGDLGNTTMFRALLDPANATLNVVSSSSKATAFDVQQNTNGTLSNDFLVTNTGTASSTNVIASALGNSAGTWVAANASGQLVSTTSPLTSLTNGTGIACSGSPVGSCSFGSFPANSVLVNNKGVTSVPVEVATSTFGQNLYGAAGGSGFINTGAFGIGTSTPSQTLDVNGNINLEGAANGIVMHDHATASCYLFFINNGLFATSTHACQ